MPDPANYGDLSSLTPGELADYFVQHHLAEKAGPHHDLRIGTPNMGLLSWALRSGIPVPGIKHLAVRQPVHKFNYGGWSGTIPEGYGKGTVKSVAKGKVLVTRVDQGRIDYTIASDRGSERFVLFKPAKGRTNDWLLINTSIMDGHALDKTSFRSVPADEIDTLLESMRANGGSLQPKIDGASTLIHVLRNHAEALSYRTSKVTGRPIVHTERLFQGRPRIDAPPEARDSVLRGEIYAKGPDGKALAPQDLNALLNSTIANSIKKQREAKTPLNVMLFDVERHGGKPVDRNVVPYSDRLGILRDMMKVLPEPHRFSIAETAETPEQARALFDKIRAGKHPLTREGVVYHPPTGLPQKVKNEAEHDVFITGTYPGEGKHKGRIGGLTYSLEPNGPTVGRVGTGLSDALRDQIAADPSLYLGRTARVNALEKLRSGALRNPALIAIHEG